MLKPEEISKKTKKTKVLEVLGLGVSQFLVFLRPPQVLARFSMKTLLKPEEVSKKNQSLEVKMLLKPEEVSKKTKKKTKFWKSSKPGPLNFCFFETSSGFGKVFKENIAKT